MLGTVVLSSKVAHVDSSRVSGATFLRLRYRDWDQDWGCPVCSQAAVPAARKDVPTWSVSPAVDRVSWEDELADGL